MQAARGTSLSQDDSDLSYNQPVPGRTRFLLLFAAVAATLYALDQATKALAVARLMDRSDVSLVGDLLVLHLTFNPGAAFSTGTAYTEVISFVAIAAVAVVVYLSTRVRERVWAVALGILLAGVAGNLTDRLLREPGPLRGHVVDFLMLPNWPVFNVADICINMAAGLILIQAFRGVRLDGTKDRNEQPEVEPQGQAGEEPRP